MSEELRTSLSNVGYIGAGVLFILSLAGLSRQETARRGNALGIAGMIIALLSTALRAEFSGYLPLMLGLAPGALIGGILARRVQMTSMPQLVAILHSFVGAAAVLVGLAGTANPTERTARKTRWRFASGTTSLAHPSSAL